MSTVFREQHHHLTYDSCFEVRPLNIFSICFKQYAEQFINDNIQYSRFFWFNGILCLSNLLENVKTRGESSWSSTLKNVLAPFKLLLFINLIALLVFIKKKPFDEFFIKGNTLSILKRIK